MSKPDPVEGVSRRDATRVRDRRRLRTLRRLRTVALVVIVVSGTVFAAQRSVGRSAHDPRLHRTVGTRTYPAPAGARRGDAALRTTSLGRFGVQAAWVAHENAEPGTTAWRITGRQPGYIRGFADRTDAKVGDRVGLYVSTDATSFRVIAYRMGYYGGRGARDIWSSTTIRGSVQPPCPVAPGTNMVACDNWSRSTTFAITAAFVPGDYLLKLVGSGGQQSWVLLTIIDPASRATYVLVGRLLTEEGWNGYGGFDFYQGTGPCPRGSSTYPVCNRARVVSFDRPYIDGNGSSDFLGNEYPLVRFCEQHGLDVTYVSDVAIDEHPELLLAHKAILSLGHDETWTYAERRGAQVALAHGVNIALFGAAAVLRHSRLQSSPLGPDREEVDYRNSDEDPLGRKGDPMQVTGNTWGSPPASWSEVSFVGQEYSGYMQPGTGTVPLVVFDATAWIFRGTRLRTGSAVPGVIDSDFDHLDPRLVPAGLQVLAHSPIPLARAYTNQGTWGAVTYSDMTYYSDPSSKGGVFDSGTVNWINTLTPCVTGYACSAPVVQQMTGNLLWLFGQGPAGSIIPPKPNWQTVVRPVLATEPSSHRTRSRT